MHPNPAFAWTDEGAMLDFARREAFATIVAPGPVVAYAPLTIEGRQFSFHLSRRNRAAALLDGARISASILGRHGYQSASWYASGGQVPTWLYEAVEMVGVARRLSRDELIAQIDALSVAMESHYAPAAPWDRSGLAPQAFDALVNGVVGFTVEIEELRGTRKFNQHKGSDDIQAMITAQALHGRPDLVGAIQEATA